MGIDARQANVKIILKTHTYDTVLECLHNALHTGRASGQMRALNIWLDSWLQVTIARRQPLTTCLQGYASQKKVKLPFSKRHARMGRKWSVRHTRQTIHRAMNNFYNKCNYTPRSEISTSHPFDKAITRMGFQVLIHVTEALKLDMASTGHLWCFCNCRFHSLHQTTTHLHLTTQAEKHHLTIWFSE